MARVKRALNAQKKRRTVLKASKGYRGQRSRLYRKAKEQLLSLTYAYGTVVPARASSASCGSPGSTRPPRQRHHLQPAHPGLEGRRCRGRPQEPRRDRRQRSGRVHRSGRGRQGRPAGGCQRSIPAKPPDIPLSEALTERSARVVAAAKLQSHTGRRSCWAVSGRRTQSGRGRGAQWPGDRGVRHRGRRAAPRRTIDRLAGSPGDRTCCQSALRDGDPVGPGRRVLNPARRAALAAAACRGRRRSVGAGQCRHIDPACRRDGCRGGDLRRAQCGSLQRQMPAVLGGQHLQHSGTGRAGYPRGAGQAPCRGLRTLATTLDGEVSLDDAEADLAAPTAWLFGPNPGTVRGGRGPGPTPVSPSHGGGAERLNVAAAAAICLYQSARAQRAQDSGNFG